MLAKHCQADGWGFLELFLCKLIPQLLDCHCCLEVLDGVKLGKYSSVFGRVYTGMSQLRTDVLNTIGYLIRYTSKKVTCVLQLPVRHP